MTKPNILYIHSHDTGRFVQPYGHAIPTPNIQQLAEEGVLFRQAFCTAPTCSPSRASLVTGQCAHNTGMLGLAHRGFSMKDYSHHILHTLRRAGYTSALAGIQHIASDQNVSAIGYDRILGGRDVAEQVAKEFLDNAPPQPFFLSVGFFETHREFPAPGAAEDPRYCLPPAPIRDTAETREDMARFKASVRILDEKMGVVLNTLKDNGLAENTLVICTTDHGIAFPRMKCTLTDFGIGVMLIMRGPGGLGGGRVCDSLASQIDIFPTVCDLLGVDIPEWVQGVSLMPVIRGEAKEVRDEIFAEVTYHDAYEPQRCIRTKRWKYIRRFGDRRKPALSNCDDSPSKSLWLRHGWTNREVEKEELYDLIHDPNEMNNVVANAEPAPVLKEMRSRLEQWMRETDDPLIKGPVPSPPGAWVNDPDAISPGKG